MDGKSRPNRIYEWRTARGMTFREIAKACVPKTSASQVQKLEAGDRSLDINWMRRLARVFDIKPSELLNDDDVEHRLSAAETALLAELRNGEADTHALLIAVRAILKLVGHLRRAAEFQAHLSGDPVLAAQLAEAWAELDDSQRAKALELVRLSRSFSEGTIAQAA